MTDANKTDITLLCKVVDNFGDIGVVYRLARSLTDYFKRAGLQKMPAQEATSSTKAGLTAQGSASSTEISALSGEGPSASHKNLPLKLRIIADNLESFHLLCPAVDPAKDFQVESENGWEIYNWNADDICLKAFRKNQPHIIVECFQCGRPEWLETLLFTEKVPEIVHIIMLDYLTAEDYAETFHKLQSLTRSARVQKVNFMPGFTDKTGGLILDEPFMKALEESSTESRPAYTAATNSRLAAITSSQKSPFTAIFFSYPRDWTPAVRALQKFNLERCDGKLKVLLAKGAGFESFKIAWEKEESSQNNVSSKVSTAAPAKNIDLQSDKASAPQENVSQWVFRLSPLPFLPQTEWDALLTKTPLLFIRGEDSLSRACLCGVPFIWHAYPQTEEYQLVKVNALLEKLRPYFTPENFLIIQKCWVTYNTTDSAAEVLERDLTDFLLAYDSLCSGFAAFSRDLLKNGDLTEHLVEFIGERE